MMRIAAFHTALSVSWTCPNKPYIIQQQRRTKYFRYGGTQLHRQIKDNDSERVILMTSLLYYVRDFMLYTSVSNTRIVLCFAL